jgi:anti-anti-sigma factor
MQSILICEIDPRNPCHPEILPLLYDGAQPPLTMALTAATRPSKSLVLSPHEPLIAGGAAEQLERQIQTSLKGGVGHVIVDLSDVPFIDSAGIRALVRGHTSAQRLARRFTLVKPNARVREEMGLLRLQDVLQIHDTLQAAKASPLPWRRLLTFAAVGVVGLGLVIVGMVWPSLGFRVPAVVPETTVFGPTEQPGYQWGAPLYEFSKLVVAAIIGMLVTTVHRGYRSEREANPTLDQAQVLLCIAGALMMILISGSLARAFGIAGAASIIRFRTPIEDARDITVLFILMGLGMAVGLGGFALAGLGTLFLCAMMPILHVFSSQRPRMMLCEIQAKGRDFPFDHVQQVFALNQVAFEPREVSQGDEANVEYLTTLPPHASLEDLSSQITSGKDVETVSWSPPKRV